MPLVRILPHVGLLLVAQVALDAAPRIVVVREGGMGLGSALIVAAVAQVAALALGATLASHLVERRASGVALVAGAVLLYAGLMATSTAPKGALPLLTAALAIAGLGYGVLLTAAFATAATVAPRSRAMAIILLLAAPLVARTVAGIVWVLGPLVLLVVGAVAVVLSVLAVRSGSALPLERSAGQALSAGRAMSAGVLLGLGAFLAIGGADTSRITAALLTGSLGVGGIETLDAVRAVMLGLGLALVVIGMTVLLPRTVDRSVRWAVPALALATFAAIGTSSAMSLVVLYGRLPEDGAVAAIASVGGGAFGLAVAALSSARGVQRRALAMVGGGVIVVVSGVALFVLAGDRPMVGAIAPVVLIASLAIGLGLVAFVLRLVLTEVPNQQRGLAAAAGVVAASVGSALGSTIGTGQGALVVTGEASGFSPGAAVMVGAAIAALVLAAAPLWRDVPLSDVGLAPDAR